MTHAVCLCPSNYALYTLNIEHPIFSRKRLLPRFVGPNTLY